MPSRKTLSQSLLPQFYDKILEKVRLVIDTEADYVTLTTDNWTSSCTEGFMAVTALKSMLLECFPFTERHTVANDWGISRKIYAVVSDNTPNIVKAVRLTGWPHLACVAHILNLQAIKPLQVKLKNTVQHFHHSTVATEKLKEMQRRMKPEK